MDAVRTCVGCRQQGNRANLVRLVLSQGNLSFDWNKNLPGRGSWLHKRISCFDKAVDRGSFNRAVRAKLNPENLIKLKEQAEKMLEI
jgi:predicted RNA-binding protein YlxR (DUF448 family)